MRVLTPAVLAIALATPALAAPPATWAVDKAHSRLAFSSAVSGKAFTGVFRDWTAQIHFDPKDLPHSDVVATINVASAVTGDQDRDTLLPDEDWFWTSRFSRAQFTARAFRAAGPGRYVAAGTLSLRGVQKPVILPFSLTIDGAVARMTGEANVDRIAFGVGQGEWQATDTVPAQVLVHVDLTARRQP
jgi:polyisoprenoid-binding protein YceI